MTNGKPRCGRLRRRRAFTIVEILITSLIVLVVLMVAYTFMISSMREGRKAQSLSEAVQAGAILLHSLQLDLANTLPKENPEDAIKREYDQASKIWTLRFTRRLTELQFDLGIDGWQGGGQVTYTAEPIDPNVKVESMIYRISREAPHPVTGNPDKMMFSGAYAQAVWMEPYRATAGTPPSPIGPAFMRVTMLLLGIPAEKIGEGSGARAFDATVGPSADRPKPYLLTFLSRIPLR